MTKCVQLLFLMLILFSCGGKENQKNVEQKDKTSENTTSQNLNSDWEEIRQSVITFNSFDGNRILESGQGFFVAENIIVTTYSLVSRANNIVFSPLNENVKFKADKFVAVDRINDLILIYCDSVKRKPIKLFEGTAPNSAKTSYINPASEKIIQLFSGKLLNLATVKGTKLYRITNRVSKSNFGMPIFVSTKEAIGVAFSAVESYEMQSFAIPSDLIVQLLKSQKSPATLESLRSNTSETVAAENRNIKGLVLETNEGNITIRLFNETKEYRDNFIKLAKEHYFDSLLIHRVIKNFGIQSGAADTRYAEKGDIVGYKGPGYTIPAHIVPGLFHKRGMIGSPRKPDTKNERLRSDGSQFYIVSGRIYSDKELDDLEKENNYKFSPTQRQTYKTVGGAPHLDGTYTVFGEVISGMEVVDKIVQVKTDDDWRPLEDIRLKKVRILK
ncbi:MAG TPA: peptidylprolyl isomerase [Draconibacterium sp.]|nr:peptidylprolyl isomerase [Draconibacterium sp.]HRX10522.1 peptidylprolyl isomerase [Draconibacterium sp.]